MEALLLQPRPNTRRGIGVATDGATVTFNLRTTPKWQVTLGGNRTLALTSGSFKPGLVFMVGLIQDGTGSRTVTWWNTIKWPNGTAPTLTTTAGRSDWFCFMCHTAGGSPVFINLGQALNIPSL